MRRTCLNEIYKLAKEDRRVFFIGSDLGAGTLSEFKKEMPERFFMEGIAEANIMGIAAGLAMNGKVPYVNTIASFLTRRAYEQILVDICMHKQNVRLIGNGGGLVYAPLGPTHQAIEDLSIMRAIPNMTVIAPCDAEEMKRLIPATLNYNGPVYIRLAKGGDTVVSSDRHPFEIGKGICLQEGADVLIVTTGVTAQIGLGTSKILASKGVHAGVLHLHTLKPLDISAIVDHADRAQMIVTVEENTVVGGLGSAVAEVIAETGFSRPKIFKRFGFPDAFPSGYGSQAWHLERSGMTVDNLADTIYETVTNGFRSGTVLSN